MSLFSPTGSFLQGVPPYWYASPCTMTHASAAGSCVQSLQCRISKRRVTFKIPKFWRRRCNLRERFPTTNLAPHNLDQMKLIPDPKTYFDKFRLVHPGNEAMHRDQALKWHIEAWDIDQNPSELAKSFFVGNQIGSLDTREYLLDSGASFHLISWQYLRYDEKETYRPRVIESPITLTTANGPVTAAYEVTVYVEMIDRHVEAYLLEDVVPVLSMGLICKDHSLKFVWDGLTGEAPYLMGRDGVRKICRVNQNCPEVLLSHGVDTKDGVEYLESETPLSTVSPPREEP